MVEFQRFPHILQKLPTEAGARARGRGRGPGAGVGVGVGAPDGYVLQRTFAGAGAEFAGSGAEFAGKGRMDCGGSAVAHDAASKALHGAN